MTRKGPPANIAASVRARLDDLRKREGWELEWALSRYAIERILYRLGQSAHADRFVLKGATLFRIWSDERGRATWDLDLLGLDSAGLDAMAALFREVGAIEGDDGLLIPPETVMAEEIRIPDEFGGVRVRLEARLGTARIPVQIDIGFGDAVVPPPNRVRYPVLLDLPAPQILAYPRKPL